MTAAWVRYQFSQCDVWESLGLRLSAGSRTQPGDSEWAAIRSCSWGLAQSACLTAAPCFWLSTGPQLFRAGSSAGQFGLCKHSLFALFFRSESRWPQPSDVLFLACAEVPFARWWAAAGRWASFRTRRPFGETRWWSSVVEVYLPSRKLCLGSPWSWVLSRSSASPAAWLGLLAPCLFLPIGWLRWSSERWCVRTH